MKQNYKCQFQIYQPGPILPNTKTIFHAIVIQPILFSRQRDAYELCKFQSKLQHILGWKYGKWTGEVVKWQRMWDTSYTKVPIEREYLWHVEQISTCLFYIAIAAQNQNRTKSLHARYTYQHLVENKMFMVPNGQSVSPTYDLCSSFC